MVKLWGLAALVTLGWLLYENVPLSTWVELGRWVLIGVVVLVALSVFIGVLRRRSMKSEQERSMAAMWKHWDGDRHAKQVAPAVVYMQAPPMPQQQVQPPAGLVGLPLDKYEWEV